jgi:hypothetical protein
MTKAKAGVRHRLYNHGPIIWSGSFISEIPAGTRLVLTLHEG